MGVKRAQTDHPIHELLAERWSPYAFQDRAVPADDLRSLFEAARWAPSSYNEQPWSYIVATSDDPLEFERLLSCLVEGNRAWAKAVPVLALGVATLRFARNNKENRAAVHDLGLAAGNLLVEATVRGLAVHQMIGILPGRAGALRDPGGLGGVDGDRDRLSRRPEHAAPSAAAARPGAAATEADPRLRVRRRVGKAVGAGLVSSELRATIDVTGVDHIYVAVADLERSERFYDAVMKVLGFRKGTAPIAGERHLHYFNPVTQYTIRPAKHAAPHDPYRPGLHHVCLRVATNAAVDTAARALRAIGVAATDPKLYPEYAPDYYATFFSDPDGIRLEIVAHRRMRSLIRDRWDELTEFEDPLTKAGLL